MTKSQRTILFAAGAAVVAVAGWYFVAGHRTPRGQPPLVPVGQDSLSTFKTEFNDAADRVRIVVLFSPTCPTCLMGTSAVQRMLVEQPNATVAVLAVWEPILATDWGRPLTFVLARMSDARVHQFWDEQHLVAKQIAADAHQPQPVPNCCDEGGIFWDMVAVYPKGAKWSDRLPPAAFLNGPVVDIESALRNKVAELLSPTS